MFNENLASKLWQKCKLLPEAWKFRTRNVNPNSYNFYTDYKL